MAWDEWEQLKAEAAERATTGMQLNSAWPPSDPSAGSRLKSEKRVWSKAGDDLKGLKDDLGKAATKLREGQQGLGDTAGCRSAAAQKELYESWEKYVDKVRGRCGALGALLERSGHDLSMPDSEVKDELDRISLRYKDTEAVGGQAKGK
ncbi:hypothetical protein ADL29_24925 [Streptomyces chattanoogensis]|uniref:Uncharacterized protein n=2 Tax=Streptomyces chattanoogensis TaxID=66876 RepID=A0A0N1JWP0_9ACTN|nr:hypothetical protein ADL29_24925 [Streptomyces chattanoogensis]